MATVKEVIQALSKLLPDEHLFYSFWSREDIDQLLQEDEEPAITDAEWAKFVYGVTNDEPLNRYIWLTIEEHKEQIISERARA